MEVFIYNKNFDGIKTKDSAIALGSFYSFHKGHQEIFSQTINIAKKNNLLSGILILAEGEQNLTHETYPLNWRVKSLEEIGFDFVIIFDKTKENFNIEGSEFIESITKMYNSKKFICGKDFKFGKSKKYNSSWLKENYDTLVVETVKENNSKISTSLVNSVLEQGDLDLVKKLINRNFSVYGEVIHGDKRGRKLGFKTANVYVDKNNVNLSEGVYLTNITIGDNQFNSLTSVGKKSTFYDDHSKTYETHILNFNKDIYGSYVEVFFLKKIRSQHKFENVESLIKQIRKDKDVAIEYFINNIL